MNSRFGPSTTGLPAQQVTFSSYFSIRSWELHGDIFRMHSVMNWRDQFAKPTGVMGKLAGHVMAMKNGDRSTWVFSLLDLKPADRVLEIGFGSGTDIARASGTVVFVAGVDHSTVMLQQASR